MASSRIRSAKDDVESICLSTRRATMACVGTKVKREIRLTSLRRILKSNLRRAGKTTGEQYRVRGRIRLSMKRRSLSLETPAFRSLFMTAYFAAPVKYDST